MSTEILYDIDGPIGYITLNRPEKLNALNAALLTAFEAALDRAEVDPAVRVIIIRGAGRAFSVGYDIQPQGGYQPTKRTITDDRERIQHHIDTWLRVYEFPKPVIAQVHGYCIAGATLLPLCADITLVSQECRIRWPALPIGGGLISTMWTWLVGPKRAKEMSFVAGSEILGAEAAEWGWANRAVPEEQLADAARTLAIRIAATPPDLLRLKKLAINRVMDLQGFRTAALYGAEWDAIAHFSPGAMEMSERMRTSGLKQAIEWMTERQAGKIAP